MNMVYVRAKRQGKYTYYWLVEGYREGSKVRQRFLKYLGKGKPSPEELDRLIRELGGQK